MRLQRTALLVVMSLVVWLAGTAALAQPGSQASIAFYPFASQDVLTGVAVADRAAQALGAEREVLGPAVTPLLIPPVVVGSAAGGQGADQGFVNPVALLNQGDLASLDGAALLRDALGVDVAVAGSLSFARETLELRVVLATEGGVRGHLLRAPADTPGRLVDGLLRLLAREVGTPPPTTPSDLTLAGAYQDYVRGLALVGAAELAAAEETLEGASNAPDAETRYGRLLEDIRAAQSGSDGNDPITLAALSLAQTPLNDRRAVRYFEQVAETSALPLAHPWLGALYASLNDPDAAQTAFDEAARYPYGQAARAAYRLSRGVGDVRSDLEALQGSTSRGALLAALVAARPFDPGLEQTLALRLSRVAPSLTFPFERLSFIAFDQDNALAAAEALVVATRLQPDNDLYWTNLGWAYYLLGFLERSIEASLRATTLSGAQSSQPYIAWYNLGLARAALGRLDEAMQAYETAVDLDLATQDAAIDLGLRGAGDRGVQNEAVEDVEDALDRYPDESALHYALGFLYQEEGRRGEAAAQFERFAERQSDGPFVRDARERLELLRAPPPPLEILPQIGVSLGRPGLVAPFRPGDRLYPSFELFTPGFELPRDITVSLELFPDGTDTPSITLERALEVPRGAVALEVEGVTLDLPQTLPAGSYELAITARADAGREVGARVSLEVTGEPLLLRQLISRNVTLLSLATNTPLYSAQALGRADSDAGLISTLVSELRSNAEAAAEALPAITTGRFEGLDGATLFTQSGADDVTDFLSYLLAQEGVSGTAFTFVDAYAQWALEGAPVAQDGG